MPKWIEQVKIAAGTIDLMLDDLIRSPEEKDDFLRLVDSLRRIVQSYGDELPADVFRGQHAVIPMSNTYPTSPVLAVVDALENLVR